MSIPGHCHVCGAALGQASVGECCFACLLEQGINGPAPAPGSPTADTRDKFGDYQVLREIARGGMGVVYLARQRSLGRTVALKMILGGRLAEEADVARFRAEARAAATLQHPHIVAIHEIGEAHGQPFFSMDYVPGQSLAAALRDGPLPATRAARLLHAIAGAVHYAHEHGILHRDLKPANVLLDEQGQPRVTDFGLAKQFLNPEQETRNTELTQTGQVLGSPNFMPPEQAAGKHRELTPASDIYSLGALLYHCLTGRPPFLADSVPETLRLAAETDPVAPRLLNPSIPRDLETVCLKCLAKEPSRRYATAQELVEELGRFLRDVPIHARPTSRMEKLWRWCRRHPALAAVSALAGVLVIAVVTITTAAVIRLEHANKDGQEKLWQSYLAQARANRWSGRPGRRFETLDAIHKAAAIRPSIELRNEAIAAMGLVDVSRVRQLPVPPDNWYGTDSRHEIFVAAHESGGFRIGRCSDGVELRRITEPGATNHSAHLSPDGRYLLAGFRRGKQHLLGLYESTSGAQVMDMEDQRVWSADFSRDGRWLAVATEALPGSPSYVLYDVARRCAVQTNGLSEFNNGVNLRFHPSGDRLAVGWRDRGVVHVLNVPSGESVAHLAHSNGVFRTDWSADGRYLAAAGEDGIISLWDVTGAPQLLRRMNHGGVTIAVHFHPQGELLASVGWNNHLRFWETHSGREWLRLPVLGYRHSPFRDDGRQLISFAERTRVDLLEIARPAMRNLWLEDVPDQRTLDFSFHPNERWLVTTHTEKATVWDLHRARSLVDLPVAGATQTFFDSGGSNMYFKLPSNEFVRWPISPTPNGSEQTGRHFILGPPHKLPIEASTSSVVDRALKTVVVRQAEALRVLSVADGSEIQRILPASPVENLNLSPDGAWLLGRHRFSDQIQLWSLPGGAMAKILNMPGVHRTGFSPDGRWLFTASTDECVCWEVGTWKRVHAVPRTGSGGTPPWIAFSADGSLGAMNFSQTSIRLFHPPTGGELTTLEDPDNHPLGNARVNENGSIVAAPSRLGAIRIWDLRLLRRELARLRLDWNETPPPPPAPADVDQAFFELRRIALPERDPACSPKQIDLAAHYNVALTNFEFVSRKPDNSFTNLAGGLQTLAGIPFDIRGFVVLGADRFPLATEGIAVGQRCHALNFLHSAMNLTSFRVPGSSKVAEYVVYYADGSFSTVPIRNHREIVDWWVGLDGSALDPATTVEAWRGNNALSASQRHQVGLQRFRWVNPRPDLPITRLDFQAVQGAPFLIAITAE